ncbi:cytochrome P450 [Acidocella aminolytica]|uniref:Cytochrome P457 n=1 Tax=Acidocella aminolytica 101 = DSM 11237 TaxID=1120923 RepID=A0A0D6PB23_9PROT|nr:cytochrome P450 [Acidocella aminolytica]GAN78960.1 cytochrome P457 [Acidocella aminolytica 101 = DSM 11237]GBQ34618.1 cytochrome P450 [Acidocella aminolytica 101 = DSM 11237]SHF11070.1 Cytochrome P450 [Acidocella aminolytica 101 = DSM 11237]
MSVTLAADFLNVADPTFSIRSQEVRNARERNWYARTPYGLAILRYAEVNALIKDTRLRQGSYAWPAHNGVTDGAFKLWWDNILLNKEGADHVRLRKLIMAAFSPKLLKGLTPRFEALANELLDGFIDTGRCEFMGDFSEPYATRVICMLLGTRDADWRMIANWATQMGMALGVNYKRDQKVVDTATQALMDYSRELIRERRIKPGEDFLTQLVQASDKDGALSDAELLDIIVLAIFGGIDTTRNQLGLGVQMFIEHPDQWDLLAKQPELSAQAVEEVMRTRPTVTWVTREAVENFEFQGLNIKAGTTVHLFSESAGSDPRMVENPGFDIAARRPLHFGFGMGGHHCLGHAVARSDMAVVLRVWPVRVTALANDGPGQWLPDSGNTGPLSLPITFQRRGGVA